MIDSSFFVSGNKTSCLSNYRNISCFRLKSMTHLYVRVGGKTRGLTRKFSKYKTVHMKLEMLTSTLNAKRLLTVIAVTCTFHEDSEIRCTHLRTFRLLGIRQ
jgi:hypothetical protein